MSSLWLLEDSKMSEGEIGGGCQKERSGYRVLASHLLPWVKI